MKSANFFSSNAVPTQRIVSPSASVELFLRREDLVHGTISGNKYRKLKYNLIAAQEQGYKNLLTFGGAFSNHVAAVAAVGRELGFETIGIIRGDELKNRVSENPTLQFAVDCGMHLHFVSREAYRNKNAPEFISRLLTDYKYPYLIPEGGTNELAVKGCEEIVQESDRQYDFICCAVGTGGTIAGVINNSQKIQTILGFPALRGEFLQSDIRKFVTNDNWRLIHDYHFGGYAKVTLELIEFINTFKRQNGVLLDPIYTGKMVFGVFDLISRNYFPAGSKVLIIHTGGLQGIAGMNQHLKSKNLPLIDTND